MATTVNDAKQALSTILDAYSGLAGVQVATGLPLDENEVAAVATDAIFLLDVRSWSVPARGQHLRDETYTLPLRVRVFRPGKDRAGIEVRLQAIVDAVDDAVQADDELQGTVKHAELTSATAITGTNETGTGVLSVADLDVTVTAWRTIK